jgi:hypothetical protein
MGTANGFRTNVARASLMIFAIVLINACGDGTTNRTTENRTTKFQHNVSAVNVYRDVDVSNLPLWRVESSRFPWRLFDSKERSTIERLHSKIFPRYRRYLRAGLFPYFVAFVSESPEPPNYGAGSIDLSDCVSTPLCKYACSGHYEHGMVVLTAPRRACEDSQLYFFTDIRSPFPRGQLHPHMPAPCVRISARAFGSCSRP